MHLSALHCRMRTDEISGNRVCVLHAITSCTRVFSTRQTVRAATTEHHNREDRTSASTDSCDDVNCDAVLLDGFSDCNGTRQGIAMYFNLAVTAFVPPFSVWPHLFRGAGYEKRRGEQLKWSLAFRL